MKHSTYWSEEHGVLRVQFVGEITAQEIVALGEQIQAILSTKVQGRVLVDNSESKMALSHEVRKAFGALANTIDCARVASYGASNSNRILARIVMSLAGRSDEIQFFATEAEALEWISRD